MKGSFQPLLPSWVASVLGHFLRLSRVRGVQPCAGRWKPGAGRDHPRRGAARARMRQELGAVGGCSTHLEREEKDKGLESDAKQGQTRRHFMTRQHSKLSKLYQTALFLADTCLTISSQCVILATLYLLWRLANDIQKQTLAEGVIIYTCCFRASLRDTVETEATFTCP